MSQQAAAFLGEPAEKVIGTDHSTICKYANKQALGFTMAAEKLKKIKTELIRRQGEDGVIQAGTNNVE